MDGEGHILHNTAYHWEDFHMEEEVLQSEFHKVNLKGRTIMWLIVKTLLAWLNINY
jgi:hypothetical protein